MSASVLAFYRRVERWPAGRWVFSRLICLKAPYFTTIAPRFVALDVGRCEVRIPDRRRVHNHIGTVHAIALCNLAELSAGLMAEVTVPPGMRWIPKGMSVEYLAKARARCTGWLRRKAPCTSPRADTCGPSRSAFATTLDRKSSVRASTCG